MFVFSWCDGFQPPSCSVLRMLRQVSSSWFVAFASTQDCSQESFHRWGPLHNWCRALFIPSFCCVTRHFQHDGRFNTEHAVEKEVTH